MPALLPRRLALALLSLAVLTGCDANDPAPSDFVPPGDEIVEGVNLTELFSAPTGAELDAVRDDWATRNLTLRSRYTFEFVEEREGDDGAELRVYRARDAESGEVLFHGVVRLPLRQLGDVRLRPLLLVLPDGDSGTSADLLSDGGLPVQASERDDLVFALLAYRGEPLEAGGAAYRSEAAPSAYDHDADDALAFLDHVLGLGHQVLVDTERLGVLGLGRGGGVALLTEARAAPYDVVFDIAGPTDLFLDPFRARVRGLLRGGDGGAFPAIEALAEEVVYPLRDGAITMEQARIALLSRSPRHFVAPPPFIAVAHGVLDAVVPVEHSGALNLQNPRPDSDTPAVFLQLPEEDHTSILSEGDVVVLVNDLLRERLSI